MPLDFQRYASLGLLAQDSLRGNLIGLSREDHALAGRPSDEVFRAVEDVVMGGLWVAGPPVTTARDQMVSAYAALLLRLAGANPAAIQSSLAAQDAEGKATLLEAIRGRMAAAAVPVQQAPPTPATLAPAPAPLPLPGTSGLPRSVEHAVPPQFTPPAIPRPAIGEAHLVRLQIREGFSVDVDETWQQVMRRPERRAELVRDLVDRLEKYFGG
jgi:hypothetical protein